MISIPFHEVSLTNICRNFNNLPLTVPTVDDKATIPLVQRLTNYQLLGVTTRPLDGLSITMRLCYDYAICRKLVRVNAF